MGLHWVDFSKRILKAMIDGYQSLQFKYYLAITFRCNIISIIIFWKLHKQKSTTQPDKSLVLNFMESATRMFYANPLYWNSPQPASLLLTL